MLAWPRVSTWPPATSNPPDPVIVELSAWSPELVSVRLKVCRATVVPELPVRFCTPSLAPSCSVPDWTKTFEPSAMALVPLMIRVPPSTV